MGYRTIEIYTCDFCGKDIDKSHRFYKLENTSVLVFHILCLDSLSALELLLIIVKNDWPVTFKTIDSIDDEDIKGEDE